LYTKHEVSTLTNCKNWGGFPKVIDNITIRQSTYDFLFNFNRNYVSILYHFRVIREKWLILTYPTCIWRARRGRCCSTFAMIYGIRKVESPSYRVALFAHPMFSHFDTIMKCDRQTHRHMTTAYTALA